MQDSEAKGLQQGLQEGERKGGLIGRITILQKILSISQPSREELSASDLTQLSALAKQFQQQLSRHGQ